MKLWIKISLICIAVLLLVVGACSTLLLLSSRNKILTMSIESAQKELTNLKTSFSGMVTYYGKEDSDPIVERTLVNYCFSKFATDTSVLISGNETLYSNISFDPQNFLPQADFDGKKYYVGTITGRNILIVGLKTQLLSENYTIYDVQDITDVFTSISIMIWQFGAICFAGIVIGIILIIFLVRYATQPLKRLSSTAKIIAAGEYSERSTVHTKDEIGELAKDFNAMAEAVQSHFEQQEEIMQRQQLFIGGVTHEFKTPLTSLIGHSETLLYTSMPEETVKSSLVHIHEQCKWLERLTQKLLRLITLQEEIEIRDESVKALLDAVKKSTAETLQKREIMLQTACDTDTLPMDFDLMQSLLINLVDNAAKASAAGQTVELRAYGRTLEVADHGIGIPEEELARITEPFYRVDKSRSKKMGGSGLGLALVKRIADAHGAEIKIQSKLGEGTSIKVVFPR